MLLIRAAYWSVTGSPVRPWYAPSSRNPHGYGIFLYYIVNYADTLVRTLTAHKRDKIKVQQTSILVFNMQSVRTGGVGGKPTVLKPPPCHQPNVAVLCATIKGCGVLQKPICSTEPDRLNGSTQKNHSQGRFFPLLWFSGMGSSWYIQLSKSIYISHC